LWHANFASPRVGGTALANALTQTTPFTNGLRNTYTRGLRISVHRGVRMVGHDGLWPGYKTTFMRIPDHDAAVVCISNDAGADPHDLALHIVDALIEGRPGVRALPSMPEAEGLPGRYLNRDTGATLDVAHDNGRVTAYSHGVAITTVPAPDGALATSRGSGDFTMRLISDDRLEVERDAGVKEILRRVTRDAKLPADLPGRYHNADVAAIWTISAREDRMDLLVEGPLRSGVRWEIEPIENDFIRIIAPTTLFRGWLDGRVLRDAEGRITGLHIDGGRARNLVFTREATG
jgi:D-aminopeptidase